MNPGIGTALDRDGFAVVRGACAPEVVAATFRSLGLDRDPDPGSGPDERVRLLRRRPALRRSPLVEACLRIAAGYFAAARVRVCFDHAISKGPGDPTSAIPWHQDQAFQRLIAVMDSLHFWIPRSPCGPEEGAPTYAVGSHRRGRWPHVRRAPEDRLRIDGFAPDRTITIEAEPGDLVVHLPLTVHCSGPNRSAVRRDAWIVHCTSRSRLRVLSPRNLRAHGALLGRRLQAFRDPRAPG